MCIGFDNPNRLRRNVYYFAYRGVRFKLMQGHPRLSRDVLMSIAPSRDDGTAQQRIYEAAGEFLSALSWKNGSRIVFDYVGHVGASETFRLRQANMRWTGPPQVPYHGHTLGFDIDPIPSIQSDEQRLALAMFREAFSCNNTLLSFLLYWQILEIGGAKAVDWVNKTGAVLLAVFTFRRRIFRSFLCRVRNSETTWRTTAGTRLPTSADAKGVGS